MASSIKNNIRRLRFDHNEMTQEDLSNRAGCTRQTIIALEQGKYVPSIEPGDVNGIILNQFSLGEYDNVLPIATASITSIDGVENVTNGNQ